MIDESGSAGRRDALLLLASFVLFSTTSAALLFFPAPEPFVWIFAIGTMLSLAVAVRTRRAWARGTSLICFGIGLALTLSEITFAAYDRMQPAAPVRRFIFGDKQYFARDTSLGYAPTPGMCLTSQLTVGDTVINDVVYTIDSNGVRETKGDPDGESWLFVGCSFTFGEGVNDDETLPSQFSAALDHRANVVNLAFHGYGAHQMLRILETDRARPLVRTPVRQVVYLALADHPQRAAGRVSWDRCGPSYELSATGLIFAGPFHSRIVGKLLDVARRSHVLGFALEQTVFRSTVSDDDIERYGRIVERSAQLAREKFDTAFLVLYWDADSDVSRRVLARLRATKLPIVLVSEIIPRDEWPRVVLPQDGHPTAEAYRRLAAGLVERLTR